MMMRLLILGAAGALLRIIFCRGEEEDEGFHGQSAAGYYSRAEDSQVRCPQQSKSSTSRPTQASSSSSLHAVEPLLTVKPKVHSSSSINPSCFSSPRASSVSPPPPSKVTPSLETSTRNSSKDHQPRSNLSQAPPCPPKTDAGNTRQQGAPVDPRASSSRVSFPSSNCTPSASPLQPKVSSPFSLSSQKPSRTSPETSTAWQRQAPGRCNIPHRLLNLFKNNIVPPILLNPLSPSNYAEYFSTLLHAEDYEEEKFKDYTLFGVALRLQRRADFIRTHNYGGVQIKKNETEEYPFVTFKVDAFPEKRPFLLSRDYVIVRVAGQRNSKAYKGEIFRVVKGTVLVEFGSEFHRQHERTSKYDVNFSFNRVCLKRAHAAVSVAPDPLLCKILFPDEAPIKSPPSSWVRKPSPSENDGLMRCLVKLEALVPFLVEGPLADDREGNLTDTGRIILKEIVQIHRASRDCKILVCAPRNRTCDALMRRLLDVIPRKKLFRANAAFREHLLVPDDIKPSCLFEGECFVCPPLDELKAFDVVTSTFMSSYRLHQAGIEAAHFTHVFLVDASSVMEPEAIVALANLVGEETAIVVSGSLHDAPRLVRSELGRRENGLTRSLFRRLMEREPYSWNNPIYVARIRY